MIKNKKTESAMTEEIMGKVMDFEKKKSRRFLGRFFIIIFILLFVFGILLWFFNQDLLSKNTYDLFSLFSEDKEIIAEYWRDTVTTIWEEIPKEILIGVLFIFFASISYFLFSKRRLKITKKKLDSIDKFEKTKIIKNKE
jgi:hypothetical protein